MKINLINKYLLIFFLILPIYISNNMLAEALSSDNQNIKPPKEHVAIISSFSKKIQLTNSSTSFTDVFMPSTNVNTFKIILYFDELNLPDDIESRKLKIQELFKIYNQISISLYDDTDKKLIFAGHLDSNFLTSTNSNRIFISKNIALSKYHMYHIVINDLPPQTELDSGYNTFELFIGDEMPPLLQFFLHLLGRM